MSPFPVFLAFNRFVYILIPLIFLSSCGGGEDNESVSPNNSINSGQSSTAALSRVIAPGSECANGGVQVDSGIDENNNGLLEESEIDNSETVCNGNDGKSIVSLVNFVEIAAGPECENGGIKVETGVDSNSDKVLQVSEITDSEHLCTVGTLALPSVVSAKSLNNNQVLITYNQEMGVGADDYLSYSIVQEEVNPEVGNLVVTNASFYEGNKRAVLLTTLSQNELTYRVTVTNALSASGQSMALTGVRGAVIINPSSTLFAGSPGNLNTRMDSDNDGLFDHEEQRGWQVVITKVGGGIEVREVSSDPNEADTDGDGLNDDVELNLRSDPRDLDTDDDQLNDAYEFNAVFSDLIKQDTDGDGLSDNLEVALFRTSPLQIDTDGDQIPDNEEVILAARNARVADLPQPSIEILSTDLQLDIRFEENNSTGTRDLESRSVSTTLTQSEEKSSARTRSTTDEVTAKVTVGQSTSTGDKAGIDFPKVQNSVQLEAGATHNWSSSWTEESTRASQDEYSQSRDTEAEVSEESSVTRRLDGASMKAAVMLGSLGDIAFNLSDIQISALVPDIRNPGKYLPIATLVPEVPDGSGLENSYTLGPLVADRGPIIFVNREVYPSQVERLMKDPTGVIYKISNFNITDELGRNFAFTSQDIIDRTTLLSIDYGTRDTDGDGIGDGSELYRVATSLGTEIGHVIDVIAQASDISETEVRHQFGLKPDDNSSLISYDLNGKALGVKFHDVMQNILGFKHYDEDIISTDSLTSTQQGRSYSTRLNNGIEHIVRIRQTCNNNVATCNIVEGSFRRWATLTEDGLLVGGDLSFSEGDAPKPRDDTLLPGKAVTLAYVQDQDLDSIPARLEVMHGCRDDDTDSDDDGLSDRLEVFGAAKDENGFYLNPADKWNINIVGHGSYEGFSGCKSIDSDGDGVLDKDEYSGKVFYKSENDNNLTRNNTSTDIKVLRGEYSTFSIARVIDNYRIILTDTGEEIIITNAAASNATFGSLVIGKTVRLDHEFIELNRPIKVYAAGLNYWWNKQDDDSYLPLGRLDAKNIDTDEDGLSDFEELNGYKVDLYFPKEGDSECVEDTASDAPLNGVICTSDPLNPDTDGDSLLDGLEVDLRADPSFDDGEDVIDLDNDGLIGREETRGWEVEITWKDDNNMIVTSTCEGLGTVGNNCEAHDDKAVASNVLNRDTDGDGLSDYLEKEKQTHPDDIDTDNDGRTDFEEIIGYASNDNNPSQIVTSNPTHFDTDNDGLSDGNELIAYTVGPVFDQEGTNQGTYLVTSDPNGESDTDGLSDGKEREYNTDAKLNDTDSDLLNDFNELAVGSDPLRADQVCVEIAFKKVTLSQTGACDGTGADTGAEVTGLLISSGQKSVPLPQLLDLNLHISSPEIIPQNEIPTYALLDSNNSIRFSTAALQECDGIGSGGAEGKGDGQISGKCLAPGSFTNIVYDYSYEEYQNGQTEVILPTKAQQIDGGAVCYLEFTVEAKPVTDAIASSNNKEVRGLNAFCGGDYELLFQDQ